MARIEMEMPKELIDQVSKLERDTTKMMEAMVKAGAQTALERMEKNVPAGMRSNPQLMACLGTTRRAYKTPSDDAINMKVGFSGYFRNEKGELTPAPLVANIFEYGRSTSEYPKQPFMRKSFNKAAIQKAMENEQKKYIPED